MKTNTLRLLSVLCAVSSLLFTGCSDDDDTPEAVNEEEVITTVTLTFSPVGGGADITATWKDLDGDGGNAPDLSAIAATLAPSTDYTLAITLLNETESPVENITEEIEEEDEDHIFYFSVTSDLFASFTYADDDTPDEESDGVFAVGLSTNITTGDGTVSTGTLKVTLLHESDKSVGATSNGAAVIPVPSGAGGETDFEIDFTVNVQ